MEILILGGDLRYLKIIETLSEKYNVDVVGYKNTYINEKIKNININDVEIKKYDVIIFPINGVMDKNLITCRFNNIPIKLPKDLLKETKENVLIFSGINTKNLEEMLKTSNRKCTFLMQDEKIVKDNAIPTSEGIIADIIINTEKSLTDQNILIFGYGNIGKVLVNHLKLLGSNITVGIIEPNDKKELNELNIKNFYTNDKEKLKNEINKTDIIINTVPKKIINEKDYKHINKEAYLLDISSHPHGFDEELLNEFFIKNKLYLGIPGKIAPITAGKILTNKINEIMEGKKL